ncbi:MAG: hypothetical protein JXQ71_12260 [Verrucomicrobia bacterium]|nr:hypothetical protein [Verrucomicrobiota bacterium]
MQPARILPDLQCSLLCEEARQEANGNFFLVGILDVVRVPHVPVTAFKLTVFNRWTAGYGQFTECVRLIAPGGNVAPRRSEVRFTMADPNLNATTVTLFANVEFAAAGPHFIEVSVDDVLKVRYPINVVVVPTPGKAPGPSPPGPPPS